MAIRLSFPLTAALICSVSSMALAQTAPGPQAVSASAAEVSPADSETGEDEFDSGETIVITGVRARGSVVGDIPPQNILDAQDVRATGATSVSELLEALAPQIGSAQGRGGEAPVLLLEGQRISGFRELRDLPTEAIERVEILPEEVALKYGYSATQKVVNIILRQRFRSTAARIGATTATDGGYVGGQGELTRLMIGRAGRTSVSLRAEGNGQLTEAERDIASASGVGDVADARTLIGAKRLLRGSATANRTIFGDVSATLNGELEHVEGRALLGLGPSTLAVLGRDTRTDSGHFGTALNWSKGDWRWSVIGNGDIERSRTGTDRDDPVFLRDRSRRLRIAGDLSAVAIGKILKLPAGDLGATVRVGTEAVNLDSDRIRRGATSSTSLSRTQANASVSIDVPISRRNRDFSALGNLTANANAEVQRLSDFGTLTRLGAGINWSPAELLTLLASWNREDGAPSVQQLGDPLLETPDTRIFDFVTGQSVLANVLTGGNPALNADSRTAIKLGANWQPLKDTDLRFRAEYVHSVVDRPVQNIFGPTPTLETAFPTRFVRDPAGRLLSADLRPINFDQARKETLRIGFDFSKPLKSKRPSQSVMDRIRSEFRGGGGRGSGEGRRGGAEQSRDAQAPAENPTANAEGPPRKTPPPAPEKAGADTASPGPPSETGTGRGPGGGRGGGRFFGGSRGRLSFSLTDTITFTDKVSIGSSLPEIDYLGGDAAGSNGGTPRHKVEARAGWSNNGLGARVSADWRSGTRVSSLTAGDLRFSPLATFDLRLFANLGEQAQLVLDHPWLRGSSVRLEVNNLANARPKVRDSSGQVPFTYQSDLLDPLGRTVMISIRKLFLPPRGSFRRDGADERR